MFDTLLRGGTVIDGTGRAALATKDNPRLCRGKK